MISDKELKQRVAHTVCQYLKQYDTEELVVGIGSGSTVSELIALLAQYNFAFLSDGVVSSSEVTTSLLRANKILTRELNTVSSIDIYIDGADEISPLLQMLKGLGGALVREKILASASQKIVCIATYNKHVERLGANNSPVVLEVIPIARSLVARAMVALGGTPDLRHGFVSDNGNCILDVYNLDITYPIVLEKTLKLIPGVVECGIFALHSAHELFLAKQDGNVEHIYRS